MSEALAADVAVLYRKNDAYIDDLTTGGNIGEQELWSVRGKLLLQASDRAKIVLSGEYTESEDESPPFQPYKNNTAGRNFPGILLADEPFEVSYDFRPQSDFKRYNLALRTSFDLGGVNLETSTGYMRADVDQRADSDASNIPLAYTNVTIHPRTISQEVRLLSTAGGPLNWIVGAYAFHLKGSMPFEIGASAGPPAPFTLTFLRPRVRTTSYAGFAEGTYEIADALFLTLGGRFTTEERSFRQNVNGTELPFGKAKKSFDRFTYRVALRYEFADNANIYATHGTGFKSGAFNVVGTSPIATDPEKITAYEVGLKIDPLDWLRTNISAYYYDYKDLQVAARTASGGFTSQNAATAEIYGGEFELVASPITDLTIRASAAYNHAEYSKFLNAQSFIPRPTGGNLVGERDVSGNHLVRAPRYTFSVGGNYEWDIAGGRGDLSGNFFRSAKLYYDFMNLAKQPAYTQINAEFGWTPPSANWRVSVWGTNLTNAKIFQMLQAGGPATTSFYQKPRTIGVGVELRF